MGMKLFSVDENKYFKYTLMVVGIIISSIGINTFLVPSNILSSGLTGICVMVYNLFGINQGITSIVLNIPIFIVASKFFNKNFVFLNFINMFIYSSILGITQSLSGSVVLDNKLLMCIYGGLLNGVGMGLLFKAKVGAGGLDVVGAIFKRRFDIPMKNTILAFNLIVVSIGGYIFGLELVLYTILSIYITAISMEITKDSFNSQKSIFVISDKNEVIASKIMKDIKNGVTFLDAEGAYTQSKKKIIYCIIDSSKLSKLKDLVYKEDEKAFISVNQVEEVRGAGFKGKFL